MGRRDRDGRTVLVVSADPCLRQGVMRMLAARGFRTIEAADERELVDCCRDTRPALVLLDLHHSPDNDATSARLVRERAGLHDTPLLIISDEEQREPGAEERGCIAEVFNFDQLNFLLGRLLPKPRKPKPPAHSALAALPRA
ncbi:MAG TPA: response regulator [Pyrinomonadaceae bacterium]|jgi:CheY-like chemotaxis protein